MGYNSKELKASPDAKKPPRPKDVIYDPDGQWKYPGQVTRIPGGEITMKGVPYPVLGVDNMGNSQMMYPGIDYSFPGDYVTEYPQLKQGGLHRTTSKNVKTSINELMKRNQDLFGPKGKRYYVPAYPDGGATDPYTIYTQAGQKGVNAGVYSSPKNLNVQQFKSQQGMTDFDLPAGATGVVRYKTSDSSYMPGVPNFYSDPTGSYIYLPTFAPTVSGNNTATTTNTGATTTQTVPPVNQNADPQIVSWSQEWVDDPNNPAGGYWKKVPVYNDYFTVPPQNKYGGMTSMKKGGIAFPQQPTAQQFFERGFVPQGPVGFYKHGGVPEAFPQLPPADVFFAGIPWQPHFVYGGMPCFECGGAKMQTGGTAYVDPNFQAPVINSEEKTVNDQTMQIPAKFQGKNYHFAPATVLNEEDTYYKTAGDIFRNIFRPQQTPRVTYTFEDGGYIPEAAKGWIQKATASIKRRGTEGVCTGDKFGGPTCPPGSKRYNLAKTFRAMAKKQYGGASDIGDQDDFLTQYTNTFNDKLRSNTAMSIADEAAEQAANMMMQFGGMPMMDYGFSPNPMQDMYAQKADYLANKQKEAGNRFYGATMNAAATANPWVKWTTPKAQDGAMITQDQFNQWMNAYNQKYNTPNQQQQWNYHPQYSAGYSQGMGMIPMNYNPYMQWSTRGPQTTSQGYPVPTMIFNPQNTYLQSYDYRGRLLGPGARKVSMTFRTYTDPVTGQTTQVPDYNAANPQNVQNSQPTYLTPEQRQERDQTRKGTSLKNRMKNFGQNVEEYFSNPTPYSGSPEQVLPNNQSVFTPGTEVPVTTHADWSEQFRLGPLPGQRYGGYKAQYGTEVNGTSMMPDYSWPYAQSPSAGMQPNPIAFDQNTNPANNNPLIQAPQGQGSYFDTTITGKRKMGLQGEASANWIMAAISGATSLANKREADQTDAEMQRLTLADNQFQAMPANRVQNQGRYNWTGMSSGMMDPNSMGVIQQPGQNYLMEDQVFKSGGAYQQGGAVELTEDQINYILANGGSIQYLD